MPRTSLLPPTRLAAAALLLFAAACGPDPADERAPTLHDTTGASGAIDTSNTTAVAALEPFEAPAFTASQAADGETVYAASCARCHALTALTGDAFSVKFAGRRVSDLYEVLSNSMPQDAPGSLSEQQYEQVVAYLLSKNGFAAGQVALRADSAQLRRRRMMPPTL